MNKFEAIQEKLIQVFSDKFETIAQIETNPNSEICIVDYQGQCYIIIDIQVSHSQCSILQNNHEKTTNTAGCATHAGILQKRFRKHSRPYHSRKFFQCLLPK